MVGTVSVGRTQWLGYRWYRHGLGGGLVQSRPADRERLEDLLLLGVQDSRGAGACQALGQRTDRVGSGTLAEAISPDGPLVSMWSVRGAPHVHRIDQLDAVRDAHMPQDSDEGGPGYVADVEAVASALTEVVTGPTPKGQASAAVAAQVPPSLVHWCQRCQAEHVPDGLFRSAGRQAQLVLGPADQRPTVLFPRPNVPQTRVDAPRRAVLAAYLRVNGPVTKTLFRDWMEGGTQATNEVWRDLAEHGNLGEPVRVQVDGRRYELFEAVLDSVLDAPRPDGVVLLPPNDPYLRQADRTLLVPESTRRQQLWKALSGPGAVVIDGEVAGTWRYRRAQRDLTVSQFGSVRSGSRAAVARSAAAIAAAVGADAPKVTWS